MRSLLILTACLFVFGGCVADSCIVEGTRVETPEGPVPVEDLRVGDSVLSVNPTTGVTRVGRISAVSSSWRRASPLSTGKGGVVWTTSNHPVLRDWGSGYETVDELRPRAGIVAHLEGGEPATSEGRYGEECRWNRVYDLTVDSQFRNFLVGGVVFHNKTPPIRTTAPIFDLAVSSTGPLSVTLRWSAPGGPSGPPDQYRIAIAVDVAPPLSWSWTEFDVVAGSVGEHVEYTVGGLLPDTDYLASVTSRVSPLPEWSLDSNEVAFRTDP